MTTYIALLRGINVGGHRVIKMADLRAILATAGAANVETYIQSGNAVFDHASRSPAALARTLNAAIRDATELDVPIVLRTRAELAAAIDANPFAAAAPDTLHAAFSAVALEATAFARIDAAGFGTERFAVATREVYLHLPDGMGKSKLVGALTRVAPFGAATARNWRTVCKLRDLAAARQ